MPRGTFEINVTCLTRMHYHAKVFLLLSSVCVISHHPLCAPQLCVHFILDYIENKNLVLSSKFYSNNIDVVLSLHVFYEYIHTMVFQFIEQIFIVKTIYVYVVLKGKHSCIKTLIRCNPTPKQKFTFSLSLASWWIIRLPLRLSVRA